MSAEDAGPAKKTWIPLIGLAGGMLVGGIVPAAFGAMLGNELATVMFAAAGMVMGAIGGLKLGWRWHSRPPVDIEPPSNL